MSVRAYKLIEIKTEKDPTFNLGQDERITDIGVDNEDGVFCIDKNRAEELLKEVRAEATNRDGEPTGDAEELEYLIKCLTKIIADCGDEEFAEYYCY